MHKSNRFPKTTVGSEDRRTRHPEYNTEGRRPASPALGVGRWAPRLLVLGLAISLLLTLGWANERSARNHSTLPLALEKNQGKNLGQTDDLLSAGAQSSLVSAAPAATVPRQTAPLERPAEIPPSAWQRMMGTVAEDQHRSRYAVRPVSEAEGVTEAGGAPSSTQRDVLFRSHSPERGLRARYGPAAALLSRDPATAEDETWELGLPLAAWGRPGAMTPAAPATLAAQANRLSYARPGIEEWYLTGERGIEQGFTIDARPAGAGELRVEMRLLSRLEVQLDADGLGASFVDGSGELALRYAGLAAWDAEGRALAARLVMDEAAQRLAIVVDDGGAAYPVTIDPLFDPPDLEIKLTASDAQAGDFFGFSVSISGDTAIVGARLEDEKGLSAGAAYIFERDEGGADNWGEVTKLTASDGQAEDGFGFSASISGDTAIVGALFEDEKGSNAGAAYIYADEGDHDGDGDEEDDEEDDEDE